MMWSMMRKTFPAESYSQKPCMKFGCPRTISSTVASFRGLRLHSKDRSPTLVWNVSWKTIFITLAEPSRRSTARRTQNLGCSSIPKRPSRS
ncbi:MAG: hypothetical protein P8Y85_03830 [Nitrospirota bacterium]